MKTLIMIKLKQSVSIILLFSVVIYGQVEWEVPKNENEKMSFQKFDEDKANEGRILYEASCTSCHGTPDENDFTLMVPSPGDLAEEKLQLQTDGAMFYKIKIGRGEMPKFEDVYAEDEIWNLIAYIRSFNSNYIQPIPNLEGVIIPKFDVKLKYDENVDKLVVKVKIDDEPGLYVKVDAFLKTMFGKYSLGKSVTNYAGIAYFDVDSKLPGDSLGNVTAIVKVKKGYGFDKVVQKLKMATPTKYTSAIAGKHFWSTDENAPTWLNFIFHATIIFFWGAMFVVIYQLRNLKKAA
ncbi:MAG: cytochrome c [Ignavibacteriae bacterium]|nr:cytochrome c [Ignavibacteriota bacterium]